MKQNKATITVRELRAELDVLIGSGLGDEKLMLQIDQIEHEELDLQRVRLFKFANRRKIFLVF